MYRDMYQGNVIHIDPLILTFYSISTFSQRYCKVMNSIYNLIHFFSCNTQLIQDYSNSDSRGYGWMTIGNGRII